MEFNNALFSLIGIVGLLFWSLAFWKFFKRPQLQIPGGIERGRLIYRVRKLVVFTIGVAGWLLISYSLAEPRKAKSFEPANIEVNDIFFVLDVSRSMLAEDFRPNRLEVAKAKINEFIKLRPTDRIGIIIFSEKAFTLLPLTTDLNLIDQMVKEIEVGFLGSGTAIGDALGLAVARGVRSSAKNKVVILLTDGVNNVGSLDPLQAAEMAREKGIKVYTVGVGGDDKARLAGYRIIPGGSIDFETLEKISSLTGGQSYAARNEEGLKKVLGDIEQLEKTKIESQAVIVYDELFWIFLIWGTFLLVFCEILRKTLLREVI